MTKQLPETFDATLMEELGGEVISLIPVLNGFEKIYFDGKVYDARTELGGFFIGGRLTDCCESFSTFGEDGFLYCKKCYKDVESGEGDGSENIGDNVGKVIWVEEANKIVSCSFLKEVA